MRYFLIALIGCMAGSASAQNNSRMVFSKDGKLWVMTASASAKAKVLVALPKKAGAPIRLQSRAGTILIEWPDRVGVVPKGRTKLIALDCSAPARLSPNGSCVACKHRSGSIVIHELDGKTKPRRLAQPATHFDFAARGTLIVGSNGLWRVPRTGAIRLLSKRTPTGTISVAPNAKRLAAEFDDGLYSLGLGPGGALRRLGNGTPIEWSQNSKWVLVKTARAGCVVRGVGGQFQCWNRTSPVAISPDGSRIALVSKGDEDTQLRVAKTGGTHGGRKSVWISKFDGIATWLP